MFLERSVRNMGGVLQGRNLLIPVIRPERSESAAGLDMKCRELRNGKI